MKLSRFFTMLSICLMLLATGCGHGGSGSEVRGTLTMTAPTVTNNATSSLVSTTVTYTNPYVKSVGGLVVIVNGSGYTLPDNGTGTAAVTVTFIVPQQASQSYYSITATTGDLVASVVATIPALGSTATTLTYVPTGTVAFSASDPIGTTNTVTMTNGTAPYSAVVNPTTANIGVAVSGANVTITKQTTATGGSTNIVVSDSSSPTMFVVIPVTY